MMKDGYTRNPAGDKGSVPLKPSSSRDENNRGQEPNFQGRRSQSQSSPFRKLRKTPRRGENFGTIESPKRRPTDDRVYIRPSNKIREHRVCRMEQRRQLARKRWRKPADHFGAPSEKFGDIKREKDPQDRSRSLE